MLRTTDTLYFFRKPAGVASSRGKEQCFLDGLKGGKGEIRKHENEKRYEQFWKKNPVLHKQFSSILDQIGAVPGDEAKATHELLGLFSAEEEYGLLNRLDTDTSGILYFARSREAFTPRRERQAGEKVKKYYLARVRGDPRRNVKKGNISDYIVRVGEDSFTLKFPVMNHRDDYKRMVSISDPDALQKLEQHGRGEVFMPTTHIEVLSYDHDANESMLRVMITKGVRHQIRVHLATLGNPILGDSLYDKKALPGELQLVSAGCEVIQ